MLNRDMLLRRRALEMMPQLPETPADARIVLAYMRQIIDEWLDQPSASGGIRPNLINMPLDKSPSSPS
jgi:hypothetical protein